MSERLDRVGDRYRDAYVLVQGMLAASNHPKLPAWVFALDLLDVAAIAVIDRPLARAEQQRRQWRAALHATTELLALEASDPEVLPVATTFDPECPVGDMIDRADLGMGSLDRFIGVVQYARSAGCSYVDGVFEPVRQDPRS